MSGAKYNPSVADLLNMREEANLKLRLALDSLSEVREGTESFAHVETELNQ